MVVNSDGIYIVFVEG